MKKYSLITRVSSRHTSQNKKVFIALCVLVCGLAVAFVIPKVVTCIAALVLLPIHHAESWLQYSTDALPLYIRDRAALIEEINNYKYTQSVSSGDKLTVDLLSKENEELRALLSHTGTPRILAGVMARPGVMPYDVVVLDKGSDEGIVEGAPVFIGNDAVIGVVDTVYPHASLVMLATTPGFTSSVFIVGPNIYTTAEGQGGGVMRIGVPQGIALTEGNLVILPGVDGGVYGRVNHVNSVPQEPEQEAFVSPELPLSGLRLVSVGTGAIAPVTFAEADARVRALEHSLKAPIPDGVLVTTGSSTASSTASSTKQTP